MSSSDDDDDVPSSEDSECFGRKIFIFGKFVGSDPLRVSARRNGEKLASTLINFRSTGIFDSDFAAKIPFAWSRSTCTKLFEARAMPFTGMDESSWGKNVWPYVKSLELSSSSLSESTFDVSFSISHSDFCTVFFASVSIFSTSFSIGMTSSGTGSRPVF